MKKVEVLWIDDELTDHSEDARNLEHTRKGLHISMVHPTDFYSRLAELEDKKRMSDLFLVDYFLDMVKSEKGDDGKYEHRGLTVAGKIRELEPERPIYVVTQRVRKRDGIFVSEAQAAKMSFDRILTFKQVQRDGHDILYYDALDYRLIRESPRNRLNTLFELLKAPELVMERLRLVLPSELRDGLVPSHSAKGSEGNAITFAKWVRETFLSTPGFVYDEIHAATHLGMNVEAFGKILPKLKKAKYAGVFHRTNPSYWWISGLDEIVFSKPVARKVAETCPWKVAPVVFKISKREWAKCVVCKGTYPETVGMNRDDEEELRAVHFSCSVPHPKMKRVLYFDEPRQFRKKEK